MQPWVYIVYIICIRISSKFKITFPYHYRYYYISRGGLSDRYTFFIKGLFKNQLTLFCTFFLKSQTESCGRRSPQLVVACLGGPLGTPKYRHSHWLHKIPFSLMSNNISMFIIKMPKVRRRRATGAMSALKLNWQELKSFYRQVKMNLVQSKAAQVLQRP